MVLKFNKYINETNEYIEEFKVGDRVIYIGDWAKNKTGKIVEITPNEIDHYYDRIGLEFDEKIGVHNCGGKGKIGYCMYTSNLYIKKIEELKEEDIEWF